MRSDVCLRICWSQFSSPRGRKKGQLTVKISGLPLSWAKLLSFYPEFLFTGLRRKRFYQTTKNSLFPCLIEKLVLRSHLFVFFAERKWEKTKSLDDTIYLLNRLQKGVWQRTTHRKNWIQLKLLVFKTKISVFCKTSIGRRKQQWKVMPKKMKRLTWKMV